MQHFLDFLNTNSGAISVLFSFVVAIATAIYAYLTVQLVRETRRMRKSQTDPDVVVRIQTSESWINFIELVLENNGAGAAYDIHLFSESDIELERGKHLSELGLFKHGLRILGPRQSIKTFLISMRGKGEKIEDPNGTYNFTIITSYKTAIGESVERRFDIDMRYLIGLVQLGPPPLLAIADRLKSIQEEIHDVTSGHKRFQVRCFY